MKTNQHLTLIMSMRNVCDLLERIEGMTFPTIETDARILSEQLLSYSEEISESIAKSGNVTKDQYIKVERISAELILLSKQVIVSDVCQRDCRKIRRYVNDIKMAIRHFYIFVSPQDPYDVNVPFFAEMKINI